MPRSLMVVPLAVALLSGCVSQSKYQALETQTSEQRAALERDLTALRAQASGLREEIARREAQVASLNKQRADLEQQKADLDGQKSTLERQLSILNERLDETEKRATEQSAQKDEEVKRLKGTYDALVKNLQAEITTGQIKVTQARDKLSVQLVEKILFDSGKADIKPEGRDVLTRVGKVLSAVKDKQIRIEGYTDSVPIGGALRRQFASNWELSTVRATTVVRFLQENGGIDGKYLSAVGYGPFRPVASNDTPEGRSENRRIEIVLTPLDVKDILNQLQ